MESTKLSVISLVAIIALSACGSRTENKSASEAPGATPTPEAPASQPAGQPPASTPQPAASPACGADTYPSCANARQTSRA